MENRRRKRDLVGAAAAVAGSALLASCAYVPKASGPAAPAALTLSTATVGTHPLGVNVAAWDAVYTGPNVSTFNALLDQAGLTLLRYPGGSWGDEYDWSTNNDDSKCPAAGPDVAACTLPDPLSFDTFSTQAAGAGASSFVTVNYGSGTPALAAGWVAHAVRAPATSAPVALWEVGNETYSCYEENQHLAEAPAHVQGYAPDTSVCPSTKVMTTSYAAHALPYLEAMKATDPSAQIGVPWAFTGTEAPGAGVNDAALWNRTVLRATKHDITFVDAHWYPFDHVAGHTDEQLLASVGRIPGVAATIRSTLAKDAPGTRFVVGETNISERLTTLDFQPVSALFAAATSLEWAANGASSVVWWDLNNYGSPTTGDYGIVSSGSPEAQPAGTPYPPYYGEELASQLTTPGAKLATVSTGSPTVLGFRSALHGREQVLLVNTDPRAAKRIENTWFERGSSVTEATYSAATATTAAPVVDDTIPAPTRVPLPALSIVVLSGSVRKARTSQ